MPEYNRCAGRRGCGFIEPSRSPRADGAIVPPGWTGVCASASAFMGRQQLRIFYAGRVQGVGFRYTVKALASGFEVLGTVRNLPDGRVELTAEGERAELEAFRQAIQESGPGGGIRQEEATWGAAAGGLRGFEIVR